jgi:hypothetical protein
LSFAAESSASGQPHEMTQPLPTPFLFPSSSVDISFALFRVYTMHLEDEMRA